MPQRRLGPFSVSAIGLGCMNICHAYGEPVPEADAARLLLAALDAGVTHFDTAALYGFGLSETLIGKYLAPHRDRFVLASKCGMTGVDLRGDGKRVRVIDGRPATLKTTCDEALRRLRTDAIDLYYLHRWDKRVPIEDSVGALADLVREGKIRAIGLSEVSAATLRRAHAVHPIAAVQSEYSLWTRNPEIAVLDACRELGVAFVAFSPLGRGVFTSTPPDPQALHAQDIRRAMPRFAPEHWPRNLALRTRLVALAEQVGCTPAQLALAWVLARGQHVHALPGTTRVAHLLEDLGALHVQPGAAVLAELDAIFVPGAPSGARYNAQGEEEVDTERF
ncbi:aldo/keto reductase [Tepidimonas aquatica]|uniref:aldo/keto reductase n=1 Tax=Tepidimonas aquatica TaxID=247482 RepID=UPI00118575DA|nr:aldo/keto reductase [Tepidimonas aquatica]